MTILNVDDDDDDREIFIDAVKEVSPSIVCLTATNALDAQLLWSRSAEFPKLDYIFLDINMPKMNGIELLKELRKDERFEQTPIYMLSTSCSDANYSQITSLKANYVAKESCFDEIVAKLATILLEPASNEREKMR